MHKYRLPRLHTNSLQSSTEATRLRGHWLVLARTTWIGFVLLSLLIYFASLPVYDAQLQVICARRMCVPGQLTPDQAQFLYSFGIPIGLYAASVIALNVATAMVWFAIGIVIFWRRYDDWMALLVALALVLVGTTVPPDQSAPFWQWPIQFVDFLAVVSLFLIFCIFPSGRFVPRWLRWLPLVYGALNVPDLFPSLLFKMPYWVILLYFALLFGCIGVLGVAQIYRYRRISNAIERQQIKWVVYGCATTIAGEFVLWLLTLIFPSLGHINSLYDLFFSPISIILILLIPLSVGMAILHSRLWDIDLIINRTLVYSILTTVLALVYFGCVVLLQQLFRALTGQGSPLAVVASTVLIAMLFQPLRQHIQAGIDLRFYRRKFNAAQALSGFSAQVRQSQEVDLASLTGDVLGIVEGTMQPEHASLWLCEPASLAADQGPVRQRILTSGLLQAEQVNRAMIYGLMFTILGLAFAISLLAERRLLQTLLGEASELLIIGSTLALVMLFQPLRRYIQGFITHYFYRRQYFVQQVLDDFSTTLRDEMDLNQLSGQLLAVVSETMQPEHASLWLNNREPQEAADEARRYTRILRL